MKVLYVLFTHNRGKILQYSISTLFNRENTFKPSEMLIIDDASDFSIKNALFKFANENQDFPIHFLSFNSNQGLGWQWQLAWEWIRDRDFDYVCMLEQDYIWRKNAIYEAISVLEEKSFSCCVSGYSNPDFYNGKQNTLFPQVMIEDFYEDPAKREYLHKPFFINVKGENILIQNTTNSCGTFICNWRRVKELLRFFPKMWEMVFERAFNKQYPERRKYAGDGPITSGISYYWYKYIEHCIKEGKLSEDFYKENGPWIDICDYSLSDHKNALGLNGNLPGLVEGQTFAGSPKWDDEYIIAPPRVLE